jgi:hypothetical protein
MALPDLAADQLAALADVARRFDAEGVRYWLGGGWAVDFRLGRVSRPHSDVDFVIGTADRDRVAEAMRKLGFAEVASPMPQAIALFQRDAVRVEVTLIEQDPAGETVTPGYEDWPWDEGSFPDEVVEFEGIALRALSVDGLIAAKRDWQTQLGAPPRPHDVADIAALEGLP